jgi:phosphoglucomutase
MKRAAMDEENEKGGDGKLVMGKMERAMASSVMERMKRVAMASSGATMMTSTIGTSSG